MAYANARVINDADSHIMESLDWLSRHADPDIRDRLGSMRLEAGGSGAEKAIARALERQHDAAATAEISVNVVAGPKGWAAFGAIDPAERRKALDDLGFARQLVFTTFAGSQFLPSPDLDVKYGGARALNRAMAEFCAGDKRLIGVGVVPLDDPERAVVEVDLAVRAGCGAIWIPAAPAGERSPGHPDLDPFWTLLAEKKIPFMLHIGVGSRVLDNAYTNNGKPRSPDLHGGGENLRFKDFVVLPFSAQMFLAALIYDGLFDRAPDLRGGVIEFGAAWVPGFLRQLDLGYRSFSRTDPLLKGLSMKPSEFIRKHVKFTPFPGEDAGRMIEDGGADLFMFSSDYPHPEGTKDPLGKFERTMETIDEEAKDRFYRRNFEEMMSMNALVDA